MDMISKIEITNDDGSVVKLFCYKQEADDVYSKDHVMMSPHYHTAPLPEGMVGHPMEQALKVLESSCDWWRGSVWKV